MKTKRRAVPPKDYLRQIFDYNPETGALVWKSRPREDFRSDRACNSWNARFVGKKAGAINTGPGGYKCVQTRINGKNYSLHRLIWAWWTGDQPPVEIDHIDGDATNNAIDNLRGSDRSDNMLNRRMYSNNTSGVCGVHWNSRAGKWEATVQLNKRQNYLGYFRDIEEAAVAVREFRRSNGFSQRHGTTRSGVSHAL